MITQDSMRSFAADCIQWAAAASDPSHRQTIMDAALTWARTADVIDRRVDEGAERLPDLRIKLN